MIFQQFAYSFKGGRMDGNSVVKCACHGVVTGWVTSWEVSLVRLEVLHQLYLVKALPLGPNHIWLRLAHPAHSVVCLACRAWPGCGGRAVTCGIRAITSRKFG